MLNMELISNNKRKRLVRREFKRLCDTPAWLFARAANIGASESRFVLSVDDAKATDPLEGEVSLDGQRYHFTLTPV